MRIDIATLFPEIFASYLGQSLLKKAQDRGQVAVYLHDIRDWSGDKHNRVDDRPFGGGPGMVLRVAPVVECVEAVQRQDETPAKVVLLSPQGRRLDQAIVEELAKQPRLLLVCGRYEGFDERVFEILKPETLSIGDYILNGGEVAAMVVIDAVFRLLPGVLGDEDSVTCDTFSGDQRQFKAAQYTRPREYRGLSVPEILLSGDHAKIEAWRAAEGAARTERRAGESG